MPKHFKRGVKREHHFLKGLEKPLEEIARIPGVKKVIPGRIYASDSRGFEIKVTRETQTGLKLVAKSDGSVQEVFLVVDKADRKGVWREIESLAEEWGK
ncbi:hypothetical protein, conserved [Thermococcus kodakarensis KOD1]|uniref:Metal-binding protein n=1 Tax=Thermococcus kodakarensis (strain ATCC BAA-918 / JCM 12380 / KOD1) TaxID=69014 RepID=Q5JHH0_THEKO|nr:DUF2103 domain-containing protein [Thermococcus kodakarensis]WCN27994.1 DUF2103 domain-containing protein [Thermococcus kodakarensis]WCN30293.1 DUF2103 domain-containing protein [Thermococcus kodakarensis]BAD86342.1 hypothetical protein, conserved [Thermococcus kodakarensis KOD1]